MAVDLERLVVQLSGDIRKRAAVTAANVATSQI